MKTVTFLLNNIFCFINLFKAKEWTVVPLAGPFKPIQKYFQRLAEALRVSEALK